ncbi:MAG: hypothetical protein V4487_07800 [Chlamydiota bacterium]
MSSINPKSTVVEIQKKLICDATGEPFSEKNPPYILNCCGVRVCQSAIQGLNSNCPAINKCGGGGRFTVAALDDKLLAITKLFQTLQLQLQDQLGPVLPPPERREEKKVTQAFKYEDVGAVAGQMFVHPAEEVSQIKFGDPHGEISLISSSSNRVVDRISIISLENGRLAVQLRLNKEALATKKLIDLFKGLGMDVRYGLQRDVMKFNSVASSGSLAAKTMLEYLFQNNEFPLDVKKVVSDYLLKMQGPALPPSVKLEEKKNDLREEKKENKNIEQGNRIFLTTGATFLRESAIKMGGGAAEKEEPLVNLNEFGRSDQYVYMVELSAKDSIFKKVFFGFSFGVPDIAIYIHENIKIDENLIKLFKDKGLLCAVKDGLVIRVETRGTPQERADQSVFIVRYLFSNNNFPNDVKGAINKAFIPRNGS